MVADLHAVLQAASLTQNEVAVDRVSVRIKPSTLAALNILCARHGTTASAFLRGCAERLTADYGERDTEDAAGDRADTSA